MNNMSDIQENIKELDDNMNCEFFSFNDQVHLCKIISCPTQDSIIEYGEQYIKYTYSSINRKNITKYIIQLKPYVLHKNQITEDFYKSCCAFNFIGIHEHGDPEFTTKYEDRPEYHDLNIFILYEGFATAVIFNNTDILLDIYKIMLEKTDELSIAYLEFVKLDIFITACENSNKYTLSLLFDNLMQYQDQELNYGLEYAFISSGKNLNSVQEYLLDKIIITQDIFNDYIITCFRNNNLTNMTSIIARYPDLVTSIHIILIISVSSYLHKDAITNQILHDYKNYINPENISIILNKLLKSNNISGLNILLDNHNIINLDTSHEDFLYALKIQIINNNHDIIKLLDDKFKLYIDTDCLVTALFTQDNQIFELLLEINKKNNIININYQNIFDSYIESNANMNKIKYLLDNYDINLTPKNFIDSCYTNNLELVKYIHDNISNILDPDYIYFAVEQAAYSNNPNILTYLLSLYPVNLHHDLDKILRKSCKKNCLDTVKILLNYYTEDQIYSNKLIILLACQSDDINLFKYFIEKYPRIELELDYLNLLYASFIEDNSLFYYLLDNYKIDNIIYVLNSCINNSSNDYVIKILQKYPDLDITIDNHRSYKNACRTDNIYIAQILASMNPDYVLNILDDQIESWYIRDKYIKNLELLEKDSKNYNQVISDLNISSIILDQDQDCPICYEQEYMIRTNCNHDICLLCILKNYRTSNNFACCLCRNKIILDKSMSIKK